MCVSKSYLSLYIKNARSLYYLDMGVCALLALRAGAFWTAERAARRRLISRCFSEICPCCNANIKEDEHHLLFECARWAPQRAASGLRATIAGLPQGYGRADMVALLLGGAVGDELIDEKESAGVAWYKVEGGAPQSPLFLSVALFLYQIRAARSAAIWQHML